MGYKMNTVDCANLLRVSHKKILSMIKDGDIPHEKIGDIYFIDQTILEQWILNTIGFAYADVDFIEMVREYNRVVRGEESKPEPGLPKARTMWESIEVGKNISNHKAYVYLISDGENIKIGTTMDMHMRLRNLQTGNAKELKILKVMNFKTEKDAMKYEAELLQETEDYAIRGEWRKPNPILTKLLTEKEITK